MSQLSIFENIEQFKLTKSIDDFSEQECINMLSEMDDAYDNDVELLELNGWIDSLYDELRKEVASYYPTNKYFTKVGSNVRTGRQLLPYQMGSLNQIHDYSEFKKWVNDNNLLDEIIVISAKYDGNSSETIFKHNTFNQSFSRGNGIEGADTTRHMLDVLSKYKLNINNLANKIDNDLDHIAIRGEVIWSYAEFANFSSDYKNPRNAVSGLMNKSVSNKECLESLSYIPFSIDSKSAQLDKKVQLDLLAESGFEPVKYVTLKARDITIDKLTDLIFEFRKIVDYELDGVVLEVNSHVLREQIQPSNSSLNPEYAVKFKVNMDPVTTTVDHIEWNVSKHGYFIPTIIYDPINVGGVTCSRATGMNAKYIMSNNIGPGSIIQVVRKGDVVPNCVNVIQSTTCQMPDVDMSLCYWTDTGVHLVSKELPLEAKILRMVYCAEKLKIAYLGEGNIRKLYECSDITTTSELLKVTDDMLSYALGTNGDKIHQSMLEILSQVDECVLAAASGCFGRGIGERKLKNIINQAKCSITELTKVKLMRVDGVGDTTLDLVMDNLPNYIEWLKEVDGYVNIIPTFSNAPKKFLNMNIVFTGFRDDDLQWYLEKHGAQVKSSVSKTTTIIVTPDVTSNSGKMKKARELISQGVEIAIFSPVEFKRKYIIQTED